MLSPGIKLTDAPRMPVPSSTIATGTSALRRGRYSAINHIYHITSCTHMRRPILGSFNAARAVIAQIRHEDECGSTQTLAFVVMPDHLHWLIRLTGRRTLSHTVNAVKSFSARQINRSRRRSEKVWQAGFHDHGIRGEEDLASAARYIVANPLRAGLVDRLGDYPHWDAVWL